MLMNYLPVGSQRATEFYAECAALEAGVAFVDCIPVFIASDPAWAQVREGTRQSGGWQIAHQLDLPNDGD